jgi:hypothetical protein
VHESLRKISPFENYGKLVELDRYLISGVGVVLLFIVLPKGQPRAMAEPGVNKGGKLI